MDATQEQVKTNEIKAISFSHKKTIKLEAPSFNSDVINKLLRAQTVDGYIVSSNHNPDGSITTSFYREPSVAKALESDPLRKRIDAMDEEATKRLMTPSNLAEFKVLERRANLLRETFEKFGQAGGQFIAKSPDLIVGLVPVVGSITDITSALTGRTLVSGEEMSIGDRLLTGGLSLLPVLGGVGKAALVGKGLLAAKFGTEVTLGTKGLLALKAANGLGMIGAAATLPGKLSERVIEVVLAGVGKLSEPAREVISGLLKIEGAASTIKTKTNPNGIREIELGISGEAGLERSVKIRLDSNGEIIETQLSHVDGSDIKTSIPTTVENPVAPELKRVEIKPDSKHLDAIEGGKGNFRNHPSGTLARDLVNSGTGELPGVSGGIRRFTISAAEQQRLKELIDITQIEYRSLEEFERAITRAGYAKPVRRAATTTTSTTAIEIGEQYQIAIGTDATLQFAFLRGSGGRRIISAKSIRIVQGQHSALATERQVIRSGFFSDSQTAVAPHSSPPRITINPKPLQPPLKVTETPAPTASQIKAPDLPEPVISTSPAIPIEALAKTLGITPEEMAGIIREYRFGEFVQDGRMNKDGTELITEAVAEVKARKK
jgi:hypothetical protein